MLRIAERLDVSLNVLKLLRQRVDLLDLIVDHLDRFRDVLDMLNLAERVRNGIGYYPLRVQVRCERHD